MRRANGRSWCNVDLLKGAYQKVASGEFGGFYGGGMTARVSGGNAVSESLHSAAAHGTHAETHSTRAIATEEGKASNQAVHDTTALVAGLRILPLAHVVARYAELALIGDRTATRMLNNMCTWVISSDGNETHVLR